LKIQEITHKKIKKKNKRKTRFKKFMIFFYVIHCFNGFCIYGRSHISQMALQKKAKQQKEMTFQDMYNNQGLFDEDEDDDGDWEPPQVQRTSQMALQRKAKQQKEMTFQDMYNNQGLFDEDDDDDGDWEPAQEHVETVKWFCTNCTMVNLDDVTRCDVCLCFYASFLILFLSLFYFIFCYR
jgi:hypothetical protein